MKKGFGVLFIIIGILNLLIGLFGLATEYKSEAFAKLLFSFVVLPLGIWMYSSEKEKEEEYKPYEFKNKPFKQKKPKVKDSKEYKILLKAKKKDLLTEEEFNYKVKKLKQKAT